MKYNGPFDQPATPDAPYVNGNPATGTPGSIPPALAFETPQREIVNFISDSDLDPSNADLHQLSRGVQNGVVMFGIDTGTANALVAVLTPVPTALFPGMTVRIKKIGSDNTGATTLNVGLGSNTVKRANGADVVAGDLPANTLAEFVWDGSFWQMTNFQGFSATTTNVNNFITDVPYCVDVGSANNIVAPFSPAITTLPAGLMIKVKLAATNTGPTTITVNALAAKAVVRHSGISLLPNDIYQGQVLTLVYDGTSFQIDVNSPLVFKFDLAAPPSPVSLLPGQYGIITFSNVTSIPFNVNLSPGRYSMDLTITSSSSNDSNIAFRPNDTSYSGKLSYWSIFAQGDNDDPVSPFVSRYPHTQCLSYQDDHWLIDMFDGPWGADNINDIGPFILNMDISTFTPKKMIRTNGGIHGGPAMGFGIWNDANAWTSLGRLTVQMGDNPTGATISGNAVVRRWV